MPTYVGAIDQGTTSSRFIVFDTAGTIVSVAQMEHAQIYPAPGHVEHDAAEIWRNTDAVIEAALEKAGLAASDLSASKLVYKSPTGREIEMDTSPNCFVVFEGATVLHRATPCAPPSAAQ